MTLSLVMRGLDPRIHDEVPHAWSFRLDGRDKPVHDEEKLNQSLNHLNRNRISRFIGHRAEKSRFFDFACCFQLFAIPYFLNRMVKP